MNNDLINKELKVINIGLASFAENLKKENTPVVSINWSPPAGGNKKMLDLLERYNKIKIRGLASQNPTGSGLRHPA